MAAGNGKVLLISYKFPPRGRVGAKRMAKFAKYLARAGWSVHVVTVATALRDADTWSADVAEEGITIHRLPGSRAAEFLDRRYAATPAGRACKVVQHLWRKVFPVFCGLDEAEKWGRGLIPFCEDLIGREGIRDVLSTGSPFTVNYHAVQLAKRVPGLKLITDFRDPWTEKNLYRYPLARLGARAVRMEREVLDFGHTVTVPTKGMVGLLRESCRNPATQFVVVTNGYDPDDAELRRHGCGPRPFRLLHPGSYTNDGALSVRTFAAAALRALDRRPGLAGALGVDFYGFPAAPVLDRATRARLRGILRYGGTISAQQVLREMRESFLVLVLNGPSYSHAIASKIFDAVHMRRPVFCIVPRGNTTEVVEKGGWGSCFDCRDAAGVADGLVAWYDRWSAQPDQELAVRDEDVAEFSYPSLVRQIVEAFQEA